MGLQRPEGPRIAWARLVPALSTAALIAAVLVLVWASLGFIGRGVSSGDDAYLAIAAKSLALGPGYGTPQSNGGFLWFDPGISSGPPLVVPLAILIRLFGVSDFTPGATALVVFLLQMGAAALVLRPRFGWSATAAFLSTLLLFVMVATIWRWEFGIFLGEPATFGFLLLGAAFLGTGTSWRGVALAGLCFSLAFMTKQIALFGAIGIVGAWFVLQLADRLDRREIARRSAALLAAGASLPIAFELLKLVSLGFDRYRALLRQTIDFTRATAAGGPEPGKRIETFMTVLVQAYLPFVVLVAVTLVSMVLLFVGYRRLGVRTGVARFAAFLGVGAAVHVAYYLVISNMRDRYLWVGIGLLCAAAAATILAFPPRARAAAMAVMLVVVATSGALVPLVQRQQQLAGNRDHVERLAVVRLLDEHPDVPFAADIVHSISDVVYLKQTPGVWAFEPDVIALSGRDFIALVNQSFTNKKGTFFKAVSETCTPVLAGGQKVDAYTCGASFWMRYPAPAAAPTTARPQMSVSGPITTGGSCNIERLDGIAFGDKPMPVKDSGAFTITGWGADTDRKVAPVALYLMFSDGAGHEFWASSALQDRPNLAAKLGAPGLTRSGFSALASATGMPSGDYRLTLVIDAGDRVLMCSAARSVHL